MLGQWSPYRAWGWSALTGFMAALAFSPWAAEVFAGLPAALMALSVAGWVAGLWGVVRPRDAAWCGLIHSSVWLVGGTGWMYVSLHQFGGLPVWMAALAVGLLCVLLSVFLAGAAALWVRCRRGQWLPDGVLLALLWFLAEWARGTVFTGFPWAASGYALVDSPFAVLAPWLGVYGAGSLLVMVVSWWVLAAPAPRAMGVAAMPMLAVLMVGGWVQAHGGNQFTSAHGRPLTVSLLQTNVPQNEKFDVAHMVRQLSWLQDVLLSSQAQLTVAPETAIPLLPAQLPEGYWSHLTHYFSMPERSALLGVPLGSYEDGYTNSVAGLSGGSAAGADTFYRYNKHHLVPFGEFIPVGFHWFVAMMNIPLGDFTRGPRNAPSFVVADQRIAPTICYEDLFGEELADRFVSEDASLAPTMFANVSNLAWFGKTVAIYQHLQIARFRSLEFQRPTIRSTNTGATVVIDHLGRVAAMLPTNTQGVLQAAVQGRVGVTPYAAWVGRLGLWPLVAFAVLGIGLLRRR